MVGSRMSARRWMGGYGIGDGPLRHRLYFASQAILVLIGFILLLLGPERVTTLANLLPAVGASLVATGLAGAVLFLESPQMRVGSGGASSMPPQQRNSIEINAPGEWKP